LALCFLWIPPRAPDHEVRDRKETPGEGNRGSSREKGPGSAELKSTTEEGSTPTGEAFSAIDGLSPRRVDAAIEAELDRLDPLKDGWNTEAFSELSASQLKVLGKLMSRRDTLEVGQLKGLLDDAFSSSPLRPSRLKTVFTGPSLVVQRSAEDKAPSDGH